MSKIETPASSVGIENGNANLRILRNDELDTVSGGLIAANGGGINGSESHDIVSPRDAASGLPTGKRSHKPFVI
jgi:hypothetical protein